MTTPFHEAVYGVGITPVTPFSSDLRDVDIGAMRANVAYLRQEGARLLYPCGNTGEFTSLSLDEWTATVEAATDAAGDDVAIAPGIGHGIATATEMLRRAELIGASGALIMPPAPVYLSDDGLSRYYSSLATSTGLPLMVYRRGGWPSDETLTRLSETGTVTGIKYGDVDIGEFARAVAASPKALWTCGVAERYAPFFAVAGAVGFTSGLGNFAPHTALDMYAALSGGDMERALLIRARCTPFEEIRARRGSVYNVSAVKTAMDAAGLAGGKVRPPMIDVDAETAAEIETTVAAWEDR